MCHSCTYDTLVGPLQSPNKLTDAPWQATGSRQGVGRLTGVCTSGLKLFPPTTACFQETFM